MRNGCNSRVINKVHVITYPNREELARTGKCQGFCPIKRGDVEMRLSRRYVDAVVATCSHCGGENTFDRNPQKKKSCPHCGSTDIGELDASGRLYCVTCGKDVPAK